MASEISPSTSGGETPVMSPKVFSISNPSRKASSPIVCQTIQQNENKTSISNRDKGEEHKKSSFQSNSPLDSENKKLCHYEPYYNEKASKTTVQIHQTKNFTRSKSDLDESFDYNLSANKPTTNRRNSIQSNHDRMPDTRRPSSGIGAAPRRSFIEASQDSGFSTPCEQPQCPRTPSPTNFSRVQPTIITSTPIQNTPHNLKTDRQPDLLPNKMMPRHFMKGATPDILNRGPVEHNMSVIRSDETDFSSVRKVDEPYQKNSCNSNKSNRYRKEGRSAFSPFSSDKEEFFSASRKLPLSLPQNGSPSPIHSDEDANYSYISDRAKREFFTRDDDGTRSGGDSPIGRPLSGSHASRMEKAVKRGLSLTNICAPALMNSPAVFTRTTSHVSLCSSGSSSSSFQEFGKRPHRTISQITLTLRKLSSVSDSSSSKENLSDPPKPSPQQHSRTKRSKSVPKSPNHSNK